MIKNKWIKLNKGLANLLITGSLSLVGCFDAGVPSRDAGSTPPADVVQQPPADCPLALPFEGVDTTAVLPNGFLDVYWGYWGSEIVIPYAIPRSGGAMELHARIWRNRAWQDLFINTVSNLVGHVQLSFPRIFGFVGGDSYWQAIYSTRQGSNVVTHAAREDYPSGQFTASEIPVSNYTNTGALFDASGTHSGSGRLYDHSVSWRQSLIFGYLGVTDQNKLVYNWRDQINVGRSGAIELPIGSPFGFFMTDFRLLDGSQTTSTLSSQAVAIYKQPDNTLAVSFDARTGSWITERLAAPEANASRESFSVLHIPSDIVEAERAWIFWGDFSSSQIGVKGRKMSLSSRPLLPTGELELISSVSPMGPMVVEEDKPILNTAMNEGSNSEGILLAYQKSTKRLWSTRIGIDTNSATHWSNDAVRPLQPVSVSWTPRDPANLFSVGAVPVYVPGCPNPIVFSNYPDLNRPGLGSIAGKLLVGQILQQ